MPANEQDVVAFPPVPEELRERCIDHLRGLLAVGSIDLDRFRHALDEMLRATSDGELAVVIRSLPPPVPFTAPARRRDEPLEIKAEMDTVLLDGHWQVGRETRIEIGMGTVDVDLTAAEFDDWETALSAHVRMGSVTVTVPRGFDVRFVGTNGAVKADLEPAIPGFPVLRLSLTTDMGSIRVTHPAGPKVRRRPWWRRRRREPERAQLE